MPLLQNKRETIFAIANVLLFLALFVGSIISLKFLAGTLNAAIDTEGAEAAAGLEFDFAGYKALNLQAK